MTEKRPRLRLKLQVSDKLMEAASAILLSLLFVFVFFSWFSLPETIPVHFDFKGRPDRYGDRISIFFSPLIALVLYVLLTILNRNPHIFNYPVKITSENVVYQYILATRMIRMLKLVLVIIFGAITGIVIYSARTGDSNLVMWIIPFTLVITFLPMVYYFSMVFRKPNSKTQATKQNQKKQRTYKLY